MKPNPGRSRKPSVITNSRWLAYATAGAASAFACAHSAEGAIHYSGLIDQKFKGCANIATFPLDQPGDFIRLRHTSLGCSSGYSGSGLFNVRGLVGAWIAGFYNNCGFNPISASNLKRGQLISNRPFVPAQPDIARQPTMAAAKASVLIVPSRDSERGVARRSQDAATAL